MEYIFCLSLKHACSTENIESGDPMEVLATDQGHRSHVVLSLRPSPTRRTTQHELHGRCSTERTTVTGILFWENLRYENLVIPFGLCNALSTFMMLTNEVFCLIIGNLWIITFI